MKGGTLVDALVSGFQVVRDEFTSLAIVEALAGIRKRRV